MLVEHTGNGLVAFHKDVCDIMQEVTETVLKAVKQAEVRAIISEGVQALLVTHSLQVHPYVGDVPQPAPNGFDSPCYGKHIQGMH